MSADASETKESAQARIGLLLAQEPNYLRQILCVVVLLIGVLALGWSSPRDRAFKADFGRVPFLITERYPINIAGYQLGRPAYAIELQSETWQKKDGTAGKSVHINSRLRDNHNGYGPAFWWALLVGQRFENGPVRRYGDCWVDDAVGDDQAAKYFTTYCMGHADASVGNTEVTY